MEGNFDIGKEMGFPADFEGQEIIGYIMYHEKVGKWGLVAFQSEWGLMPMVITAESEVIDRYDQLAQKISHDTQTTVHKVRYASREVLMEIEPDDWEPSLDDFTPGSDN